MDADAETDEKDCPEIFWYIPAYDFEYPLEEQPIASETSWSAQYAIFSFFDGQEIFNFVIRPHDSASSCFEILTTLPDIF